MRLSKSFTRTDLLMKAIDTASSTLSPAGGGGARWWDGAKWAPVEEARHVALVGIHYPATLHWCAVFLVAQKGVDVDGGHVRCWADNAHVQQMRPRPPIELVQ